LASWNWLSWTFNTIFTRKIWWNYCVTIATNPHPPLREFINQDCEREAWVRSQHGPQKWASRSSETLLADSLLWKNNISRSKPISWNQPICITIFLQNLHFDKKHTFDTLLCVYCVSFAQKMSSSASLKQENDLSYAVYEICFLSTSLWQERQALIINYCQLFAITFDWDID